MRRWLAVLLMFAVTACTQGRVDVPPTPLPVELASPKRVVIVGDTYTAGTVLAGNDDEGWPALAFSQIAATNPEIPINPVVDAQASAGYEREGEDGMRFLQMLGESILATDDLIVLFGSRNDADVPMEVLQPAVHQTLGQTRSVAPQAKLLVIGPAWAGGNPPPSVYVVRDIVRSEAAVLGLTFVDPLKEQWLFDRSMVSRDGINPSGAGYEFLADQIAPLIIDELRDSPTKVS